MVPRSRVALRFALLALLLGSARADEPVVLSTVPELRRALGILNVRRAPEPRATLRGQLQKSATVLVLSQVEGPDCKGGWGQLAPDAFVCLTDTEPSDEAPRMLPELVDYPVPTPEESATYSKTGKYTGVEGEEPFLPYIYGRRGRHGDPPVFASAAAYAAGEPSVGPADPDQNLLFVGAEATERGEVLVRPDGTVIPSAEVVLYAVDRLVGRDLQLEPLPEGRVLAWATATAGTPVYREPRQGAEAGAVLPYHAQMVLDAAPADADGRWWTVPDALGPGVPGYVLNKADLRQVTVLPPPAGVGEALWLDVDLSEQVLMAWQGGELRYATLVSTGKRLDETPPGLYRIYDKTITTNMRSLPGAAEPYAVEAVPWVMHFAPRYALHGAFWHRNFGHVRSHGCINLSPRDARWVFEHIGPTLRPGWMAVWESPADPGTVLRVRAGLRPVTDRRAKLK